SPRASRRRRTTCGAGRRSRGGRASIGAAAGRAGASLLDRACRAALHGRSRRGMIPGLTGSLLSHEALGSSRGEAGEPDPDARRRVAAIVSPAIATMGPATSARLVFDRLALPLAAVLGF